MTRKRRARPNAPAHAICPYVGKGGLKLAFAIERFKLSVAGLICADLGSHVGGFVDCLLQAGAAKVYSVDTCYGTLAWKLRQDPRVVAMERANALHAVLPEPVAIVTLDVGWTRQRDILPAAAKMLAPGGRVVSLVKPQYEAGRSALRSGGVISRESAEALVLAAADSVPPALALLDRVESPLLGSGGNVEFFFLLERRS